MHCCPCHTVDREKGVSEQQCAMSSSAPTRSAQTWFTKQFAPPTLSFPPTPVGLYDHHGPSPLFSTIGNVLLPLEQSSNEWPWSSGDAKGTAFVQSEPPPPFVTSLNMPSASHVPVLSPMTIAPSFLPVPSGATQSAVDINVSMPASPIDGMTLYPAPAVCTAIPATTVNTVTATTPIPLPVPCPPIPLTLHAPPSSSVIHTQSRLIQRHRYQDSQPLLNELARHIHHHGSEHGSPPPPSSPHDHIDRGSSKASRPTKDIKTDIGNARFWQSASRYGAGETFDRWLQGAGGPQPNSDSLRRVAEYHETTRLQKIKTHEHRRQRKTARREREVPPLDAKQNTDQQNTEPFLFLYDQDSEEEDVPEMPTPRCTSVQRAVASNVTKSATALADPSVHSDRGVELDGGAKQQNGHSSLDTQDEEDLLETKESFWSKMQTIRLSPDDIVARRLDCHRRVRDRHVGKTVSSLQQWKATGSVLVDLFELYDRFFFGRQLALLLKRHDVRLGLCINPKLTVVAGKVVRNSPLDYRLELSSLFDDLFAKGDTVRICGGVPARNRLEAMQLIFEHEILHLIEEVCTFTDDETSVKPKNRSKHSPVFEQVLRNVFGHRSLYHQLVGTPLTYVESADDVKNTSLTSNERVAQMWKLKDQLRVGHLVQMYAAGTPGSELLHGKVVKLLERTLWITIWPEKRQLWKGPYELLLLTLPFSFGDEK